MKLGVNCWIWDAPFRTDRHLELLEKAKRFGAQSVEIAAEEDAVIDTAVMRRALQDHDLGCSVVGLFGSARDLSAEEQARHNGLDYARRCLDLCAAIGADLFTGAVIGVGGTERLAADEHSRRLAAAVESLRELGDHAQTVGVKMAVEILNRYESNLVNTAQEGHALIELVDHPCVGLHLDTFHMALEESDWMSAFRAAGQKLFHLHASESHRGTPGTGLLPWATIREALVEVDYDGCAVIESFNPNTWIGPLAKFWRSFAPSPDALARDGLAFLRQALQP